MHRGLCGCCLAGWRNNGLLHQAADPPRPPSVSIARERRACLYLSISIASGIFLGAFLTGHPYLYLKEDVTHVIFAYHNTWPQRVLVDELQPFGGEQLIVIVVCALLLWRYMRGAWDRKCVDNPVFILSAVCWILGFCAGRFWFDWGMPALMVWMALEFQDAFKGALGTFSWNRVRLTAVVAITLFFALTNDSGGRWTRAFAVDYLSQDDPEQKEWLPSAGGIIYSDDMGVFYETFFRNPKAPWRYILGFEPGIMPPEDLSILRHIQMHGTKHGADELFRPWVEKMRPQDRLVIRRPVSQPPNISGLEWAYVVTNTWVGRLPRVSVNKRSN